MVPDWAQSRCPFRGALHSVVVYAFPQGGLIKPTVQKAIADAALAGVSGGHCALLAQAG